MMMVVVTVMAMMAVVSVFAHCFRYFLLFFFLFLEYFFYRESKKMTNRRGFLLEILSQRENSENSNGHSGATRQLLNANNLRDCL